MRKTGFRIDTSQLQRKLDLAAKGLRAETFRPQLLNFVRVSLNEAVKLTPAREYQLIRSAQMRQYSNRINYIPSFHTRENPTLIVKPTGHFLYFNGKWLRPDIWKVSNEALNAYLFLLGERQRRMETVRAEFVAQRAQARFLYKKSWTQVGASIGLDIRANASVKASVTRRKPNQDPPAGYAQIRGGKRVLSVVIYNPFLTEQTAYWKESGADIIRDAMAQHKSNFDAQVKRQLQRALYAIFHRG
jgi:hypothetical protein